MIEEEDSYVESESQVSDHDTTPTELSEESQSEPPMPIRLKLTEALQLWAFVESRTQAFLPSIDSDLGSRTDFLEGILTWWFSYIERTVERDQHIDVAPSCQRLFEMLKEAQEKNEHCKELDFGYELG